MNGKRIAFYTLGCKLNFSESSSIAHQFVENGYDLVDHKEVADVYVIHSCSVTAQADKKTRAAVRQLHRRNESAVIAVIGCYAQLKPGEVASIDGVKIVLGTAEKFDLLKYVEENSQTPLIHTDLKSKDESFIPSFSIEGRTRSFLKIQDGCDNFCAYCTIPFARGRSRSDTVEATMHQFDLLLQKESKEIVLTGVNIGDFGKKNNETFFQLLSAIEEHTNQNIRVRISSIEPDLLTNEIIHLVASSKKIMPHFHIPLQAGSDPLLKAMNRHYDSDLFINRIQMINELIPNACIAIDVIAGLPGETEEDFETTYDLLNYLNISYLHVFPYSERDMTKAIKLNGKVPVKERDRRVKLLLKLSDLKKQNFYKNNLNKSGAILFESDNDNGYMFGFSENYIRVKTRYNKDLINQIVLVKFDKLENNEVYVY